MPVKKIIEVPKPGTEEAIIRGCLCPVIDNNYGEGVVIGGKVEFWITGNCPLHGFDSISRKTKGKKK